MVVLILLNSNENQLPIYIFLSFSTWWSDKTVASTNQVIHKQNLLDRFLFSVFVRSGMASITVRLLEPGPLEEDYPIKIFQWKQKILKVFYKRTKNINLKPVSWEVRYFQTSWTLNFTGPWESWESFFCFQKALWLGNLHLIASVQVVTLCLCG